MNASNFKEHNIIGTAANRRKWLRKLKLNGHSLKDARWIYEQAVDLHEASGYPKPKFVGLLNGYIGALDGVNTAPVPGKNPRWDR